MLPLPVALARAVAQCPPPEEEREVVNLPAALGRIAARDVESPLDLPELPTSIVDGYALQSRATAAVITFTIQSTSHAGHYSFTPLDSPHHTIYVTTGTPLPPGADAVVKQEEVSRLEGTIALRVPTVLPHTNVRRPGSDLRRGDIIIYAGSVVGPAEIGMLSSVGIARLEVYPALTAGILSTGDEIVDVNTAPTTSSSRLPPGMVFDANRPMLAAFCTEMGVKTVDFGICPDDESAIVDRIVEAMDAGLKVMITSGGVSRGSHDLLASALRRRFGDVDFKLHFDLIHLKPGKPCTFMTIRHRLRRGSRPMDSKEEHNLLRLFSLPGNPCSSFVTFHTLVAPCLRRMCGWSAIDPVRIPVALGDEKITLDPERPEFVRARLDDVDGARLDNFPQQRRPVVVSTGFQRSSRLASCLDCDFVLALPSQSENGEMRSPSFPRGTVVDAIPLRDLRHGCRSRQSSRTNDDDDDDDANAIIVLVPENGSELERLPIFPSSSSRAFKFAPFHEDDEDENLMKLVSQFILTTASSRTITTRKIIILRNIDDPACSSSWLVGKLRTHPQISSSKTLDGLGEALRCFDSSLVEGNEEEDDALLDVQCVLLTSFVPGVPPVAVLESRGVALARRLSPGRAAKWLSLLDLIDKARYHNRC